MARWELVLRLSLLRKEVLHSEQESWCWCSWGACLVWMSRLLLLWKEVLHLEQESWCWCSWGACLVWMLRLLLLW